MSGRYRNLRPIVVRELEQQGYEACLVYGDDALAWPAWTDPGTGTFTVVTADDVDPTTCLTSRGEGVAVLDMDDVIRICPDARLWQVGDDGQQRLTDAGVARVMAELDHRNFDAELEQARAMAVMATTH